MRGFGAHHIGKNHFSISARLAHNSILYACSSLSVRSPHTALAQETVGADPEAQAIQVQARTSLSKKASRYTSRIGTFQGISLHLVHVV